MCVLVYQPARVPIAIDNQTFFYIAERAASGVAPHVSVVNHKLALAHLLSAAAIAIGRHFGIDDIYAGRALSVAAYAMLVALTGSLALRLTRRTTVALLAGLAMLTFAGLARQAAMGFRPHLFATLFVTAALVAYADDRPLRAGALAAAGLLCWQPALAALIGVAGAAGLEENPRRSLLRVAAGATIVVALHEGYFLAKGALHEQLYQSIVMASFGGLHDRPSPAGTLRYLFLEGPGSAARTAVSPLALLGACGALAYQLASRPVAARRTWRERGDLRAATFTAATAIVLTFVDHQSYPDKFFLLPFMAIATAWLPVAAIELLAGARHVPFQAATVCAVAVGTLALVEATVHDFPIASDPLGGQRRLAFQLRSVPGTDSSIWAVGCLHLLAFNHMDNYSRFGVLVDRRVRAYAGKDFRPLRDGRMPRIILLDRLNKPNRPAWLAQEYDAHTPRDFAAAGIELWLDNKLASAALPNFEKRKPKRSWAQRHGR